MGLFDSDSDNEIDFHIDIDKKQSSIRFTGDITPKSIHQLKSAFIEIVNAFKKNDERIIYLEIQSDGGDLFSGSGMFDWLIRYKDQFEFELHTYAMGLVASAGTLLFMAGCQRDMGMNSYVLIHNISSSNGGGEPQHLSILKQNFRNDSKLAKNLQKFYETHCKIPPKKLQKMMDKDMYIGYDKCMKYGILTEEIKITVDSESDEHSGEEKETQPNKRRKIVRIQ